MEMLYMLVSNSDIEMFSYIMARASYISTRWCQRCHMPTQLGASSLIQQSAGRYVFPPGHIILIPSPPFIAFILYYRRSNRYKFYSHWFNTTMGSNPRCNTLEASTLTITPPMQLTIVKRLFSAKMSFLTGNKE
jgi:hypothetical protein